MKCGTSPGVLRPSPLPLSLRVVAQGLSCDVIFVFPEGVAFPIPLSSFECGSYVFLVCNSPQLLGLGLFEIYFNIPKIVIPGIYLCNYLQK